MFFVAFLIAPAVPNGVFSIEYVILQPKFLFFLTYVSICFVLYPVHMIISIISNFFRYSILRAISGMLLIGINGFGILSVSGRNLVPLPPAKINAFITNLIYLCFLTYVISD
uniref:Uncharacterized protein n=1 Tax=uncultured marine thaumarchaeote KM3_23_F10 TaxID=1456100 RepID=A0A075GV12_9ARCH|nr:hypothetical protein [uncultured marine thaumarchaeote KM3_23_F10]